MHFTTAIAATMATAATASVLPRADYGAWNVSISTSGSGKMRIDDVKGAYATPQLNDNIPVNCHFQGSLNGETINKLTCDPASFHYVFEGAGYDDGYLYQLTLSQTVTLDGTNVTVNGVSDKFKATSNGVTGKGLTADNIIVQVSTAVA